MRRDSMSDLGQALRSRDPSAWDRFYSNDARDLYGFILRLVRGNRGVADDLFQAAWLAALDNIDNLAVDDSEPRAWLFGIARNLVAQHWRRSKGTIEAHPAEQAYGTSIAARAPLLPDDCLMHLEQANVVRAALLLLSPRQREVLLAKYVDGSHVAEIAAAQGITAKAVESLLSRAREQLRSLLKWYFTGTPGEKK
jgi:RNA polymerase sigma-70 factor, ECF subfamily